MKKENCHEGHRQRLRDLVETAGLNNISKIQAVEYFLTFIFPRGDVNPLAHRLLDRYGTFANIIDANVNDLSRIHGINTETAKKIHHFGLLTQFYVQSKLHKKISLKNTKEFLNYLEDISALKKTENLFFFAIDNAFQLLEVKIFDLNNVRKVGVDPMALYDFISSTKLSFLIVAHNHPAGSAFPTNDDVEAVGYIENLIKHIPCQLIDSFIVGIDGIYSQKQKTYIRKNTQPDSNFDFFETK